MSPAGAAKPSRAWFCRPRIHESAPVRRLHANGVMLVLLVLSVATTAHGYEARVDGQSVLQLYAFEGYYGAPSVSRQRLTHSLGLDVVDLAGSAWNNEPWINVRVRMRMDADYGINPAEQDPTNADYFVPGLKTAPVDVMFAYVEGGGWLRNTTGFRLGRQTFFDELGWWSLDGARVAFSPGRLFELAGYVGFEQRGGVPLLTTSHFESGGVFRGNRAGMAATEWPGYLQSTSLAPAAGGSLVLLAIPHLRARIDYRRVWQRDQVVTSPFLDARGQLATESRSRVSTDRAGLSLGYDFGQHASADGSAVYDLYGNQLIEHRASVVGHVSKSLRLYANYRYRLPTFDADSIFNWFGAVASTELKPRVEVDVRRDWSLGISGGVRWYQSPWSSATAAAGQVRGFERDAIFGVDSTWRARSLLLRLGDTTEVGDAGDRIVGDAYLAYSVFGGALMPSAILTFARWRDHLRSDWNSSVFTYVLGCRYAPIGTPRFGVDWEHSLNDVAGQRFRVVASVDVRWP